MEENKNTQVTGAENNNTEPKTYTQEEVDALLQKEADRRVTEALKKAERKNQEKVKEAQKLAQISRPS